MITFLIILAVVLLPVGVLYLMLRRAPYGKETDCFHYTDEQGNVIPKPQRAEPEREPQPRKVTA